MKNRQKVITEKDKWETQQYPSQNLLDQKLSLPRGHSLNDSTNDPIKDQYLIFQRLYITVTGKVTKKYSNSKFHMC